MINKAYHKGGSIGTEGIPDWITVGVLQVQTRGGFLHQFGFAVGVFLGVTAKVSVGWQRSGSGCISVGCFQVVLQTLHVIRGADTKQLGLLLLKHEKQYGTFVSLRLEKLLYLKSYSIF